MSPRWLAAAVAGVGLAACGGSAPATVASQVLGLPAGRTVASIASTTLYTSPDGGIYRNPDPLEVIVVGAIDASDVAGRLGKAAAGWAQLSALGRFEVIGFRLRNDGKVGSDPEIDDLQIASDFAPPTATGPLQHYYHPLFPLAALAERRGSDCGVHLDPGQSSTVLLVYPPVRQAPSLLWGRYQDFAVSLHAGGAVPDGLGDLFVTLCHHPKPPPI
jgi:hypothetical protein